MTRCKECFKCKQTLPLSSFYKHKMMGDGHLNKCMDCTKTDVKKHRADNVDRIREYDRNRGSRQTAEDVRKYRKENPDRYKAHSAVNYAVRKGVIQKLPCQVCGNKRSHAHHPAYSLPLDVVWLCAVHHRECHK